MSYKLPVLLKIFPLTLFIRICFLRCATVSTGCLTTNIVSTDVNTGCLIVCLRCITEGLGCESEFTIRLTCFTGCSTEFNGYQTPYIRCHSVLNEGYARLCRAITDNSIFMNKIYRCKSVSIRTLSNVDRSESVSFSETPANIRAFSEICGSLAKCTGESPVVLNHTPKLFSETAEMFKGLSELSGQLSEFNRGIPGLYRSLSGSFKSIPALFCRASGFPGGTPG